MYDQTKTYSQMFTATLFIIARKVKTMQMSINGEWDGQNMMHPHKRI